MNCPKCNKKTNVTDSQVFNNKTYRKRVCPICKESFYTVEDITNENVAKRCINIQRNNKRYKGGKL